MMLFLLHHQGHETLTAVCCNVYVLPGHTQSASMTSPEVSRSFADPLKRVFV